MPQSVCYCSYIHASISELPPVRVPEIMHPNPRQLQPLQPGIVVSLPDIVLMERAAIWEAEDQTIVPKFRPES